ncbi:MULTISPECIES: hypothetical protein [Bacillus cereus group]|nr:hypothetical protein [Bacillus cereus]
MIELYEKVVSEIANQKTKELRTYGYSLVAGVVITKKPTLEFQYKYNN